MQAGGWTGPRDWPKMPKVVCVGEWRAVWNAGAHVRTRLTQRSEIAFTGRDRGGRGILFEDVGAFREQVNFVGQEGCGVFLHTSIVRGDRFRQGIVT